MPPDPRVNVGVAAWVTFGRDVLLLERRGRSGVAAQGFGTWSVPGGWLDYGETPEAAVVREGRR